MRCMSRAASSSSFTGGVSALKSKSPAEFFADNQHIAGFDNPGKSLYTTLREFVENSLDAAESIGALPQIELSVEKLSAETFNALRGIDAHTRADLALYEPAHSSKAKGKGRKGHAVGESPASSQQTAGGAAASVAGSAGAAAAAAAADAADGADDDRSRASFFRVTCRDNGSGIAHDLIPRSLGIVLSSTKYGVKQTRGKFGLGAKMALVWAKKSTGLPVEVTSSTDASKPVSYCKLDIDIYKNEPHVLAHERRPNDEGWRGTEISVVIGGKWTAYQSKVLNYLKQLAVITPYAQLEMTYTDQDFERKSWRAEFKRRTDVMPPPAREMKHHPSSVDNLLVEQLIHQSKPHCKLKSFLQNSFSSISAAHADRLITELQGSFSSDMDVHSLDKKHIHQITTLFRQAKFPQPDQGWLSPAGEYNLRLGIMKELKPDFVATCSHKSVAVRWSPVEVYEGHPFIVEAAVSVGGSKARQGITCYRYANRIPLLFEGGNDVVSVVANTKIKWSTYKLNNKTDKLCVFVSLVSTKIPFKGTSKEYVGDDKGILHDSIRKAITGCAVQIRKRMVALHVAREKADRRKQMAKYIPDVSRSFMTLLNNMADMSEEGAGGATMLPPPPKRRKIEHEEHEARVDKLAIRPEEQEACANLLRDVASEGVSEELLHQRLLEHVDAKDAELSAMGADDDDLAGVGAASASAPFFIGGIDTENVDMKCMYGEDFKITFWQ